MKYFLVIIFTLSAVVYAQEQISVHQRDKLKYGKEKNFSGSLTNSGQKIIPLRKISDTYLSKSVFGFLPYWEYPEEKSNLKYDLLSHIAIFDFEADSTGSISYPPDWPWTEVLDSAHLNNVKVIMCITCFNKDMIRSIISDTVSKENFFNNVLKIVNDFNLDGVNIDFEDLYPEDEGAPISNFMKELTELIHSAVSGSEVSIDIPPVNWSSDWHLSQIANNCDYIFIMGYNFYGDWSDTAGPSSPLTGNIYNITFTLNDKETGFGGVVNTSPEKLILGIPYYGNEWITKSGDAGDSVISFLTSTYYRDNVLSAALYGRLWDSTYQVPWFKWQSSGTWHQVWYDDEESIGLKYDLAVSKNLKGVGMWALGYDGSRPELWDVVRQKFLNIVSVEKQFLQKEFVLYQNYPNPFNPTTKIKYQVPSVGTSVGTSLMKFLQLKVYDILGNEISTLVNEEQPAGNYEVDFDASKYNLSSGIYFYRLAINSDKLQDGRFVSVRKMTLLK